MRIGITGQNGFIGYHLTQTIKCKYSDYAIVPFQKSFFEKEDSLKNFVSSCDVVVHLAGVNRAETDEEVYDANIKLITFLKKALINANFKGHLLFASSSQENGDSIYGKAKKESRVLLEDTINSLGGKFTGLIIPNVFGPFCKPNYNSFVATFCSKILNDEAPEVTQDANVLLLYVGNLVTQILEAIRNPKGSLFEIRPDLEIKVTEVLNLLNSFKDSYIDKNTIPSLKSTFELEMFNTFRSYKSFKENRPSFLLNNIDERGSFSELIRTVIGGQFSYSTTLPGFTRGNHFHTRKIERFMVIGGEAKICLRKTGSKEVHEYYLNGDKPSFVDMPIWYTHNITNIGATPLITAFWINESYNSEDADTYFENV
ncbi:NAD-dependent epimerase/dehydratase family protein [Flavobacteriaceae bacterium]|nr:NAD-dependent epimerase/dehydratase family protein [Flavobacteriaceae bacterium]